MGCISIENFWGVRQCVAQNNNNNHSFFTEMKIFDHRLLRKNHNRKYLAIVAVAQYAFAFIFYKENQPKNACRLAFEVDIVFLPTTYRRTFYIF